MITSSRLHDPGLPSLAVLTGPEAHDLLSAAIDPSGQMLDARITQIRYLPGKSIVVQYTARIRRSGGGTSQETIVAASGSEAPDDAFRLTADGVEVALWRYPNDPSLPGLVVASDPDAVLGLLEQLGAPTSEVRLRRRAYRPGRRAVIEAITPRTRVYLKVLRPSRVGALQKKHAAMAGKLPVPHSLGWSSDQGLVALQAMPGRTLRKSLEAGKQRLPTGEQLIALLDAIPGALGPRVTGPGRRAASYARVLQAIAPELSDRVANVVGAVSELVDGPEQPVHGDFHSSQVLVRDTALVGLIDVDTAGYGQRADDLAVMLAHLATMSVASGARRTIDRYGASLIRVFDRYVEPRDLRFRTAASILGFAAGPFRVQQPHWQAATAQRVVLAEQWIESATTID